MVVRVPAGTPPPGGAVCPTGPSYATVQPPGPGSWRKLAGAPPTPTPGRQVPQGQPSRSCEGCPVLPVPVPCLWKLSWPGPPLGGTSCAHPSDGRRSLLGSTFCGPAGEKPPGAKAALPRKGGQASFLNGAPVPSHLLRGSLPPAPLSLWAGRPPSHPLPPPAHPTWPWRPE